MVLNTSDDLPDPETPVNTVSRRLGISTLTSLRLCSRAPWTRIRSWLSAGCWLDWAIFALIGPRSAAVFTAAQPRRTSEGARACGCADEDIIFGPPETGTLGFGQMDTGRSI